MDKNKYWERFLRTGRVEDYLSYKMSLRKKEDTEFATEPLESENNEQSSKEGRNRTKDDTSS